MRMHHKLKFLYFIFLIALCACKDAEQVALDYALNHADGNRKELQAALDMSRNDTLRRQAVRRIIANSSYYVSRDGEMMDSVEQALAELPLQRNKWYILKPRRNRIDSLASTMTTLPHCQSLTSVFILENADLAIAQWKNRPWNSDLSFEEFSELLLPYCIDDEPQCNWRKIYSDKYSHVIDSILTINPNASSVEACCVLLDWIEKKRDWIVI